MRIRKTLSIGLGAAAFTGMLMTAVVLAPAGNADTTAAAACGQLFDDFVYTSSSDAALRQRGWTVRSGGGGPGVDGNTWSPSNVDFPGTGSAKTARLRATTNGTPTGTVNSELYQRRKFKEGTYSARIRFTNAPVVGADGDPINQTFFTITPLDFPNDPDYGENDFEYLPNGGWGGTRPTMHNTTYETYQPDPWQADNLSTPTVRDLNGWHDYTLQVSDGSVRYYIDGVKVAEHGGHVYPETVMSINFNIWFIDLNSHTGGTSTYEQEVDYLYFAERQVVDTAAVTSRVAAFRAAGTAHTDSVTGTDPGTCAAR
ncbi:glycoside hydrolase family 16 protein [Virgisporangium aliadipatigenens]|nr:glycoside hydrolase family 16 protein [Virgisporangium aliadipatigenens]